MISSGPFTAMFLGSSPACIRSQTKAGAGELPADATVHVYRQPRQHILQVGPQSAAGHTRPTNLAARWPAIKSLTPLSVL
jgi:hypothetical protein